MTTPIETQLHDYFEELERNSAERGFRPRPLDGAEEAAILALDPFEEPAPVPDGRSRNRWLGAAAAAIIAIIVASLALVGGSPTEVEPVAEGPETDEQPPADPGCDAVDGCTPFDESAALGYVERWNAGFRAGDLDALGAAFPPGESEFENIDREAQLHLAAWDIAQGSTNTDPVCAVRPTESQRSILIRCEYENLQPVRAFVGADPIRVAELFRVEAAGIVAIDQTWLDDWMTVNDPFLAWYAETHPDDIEVRFRTWSSADDASRAGERRREAAEEWAAWLIENGCVYDEPCRVQE